MKMIDQQPFYNLPDAGMALGYCSRSTLYRLIEEGKLVRVNIGRKAVITGESLARYVNELTSTESRAEEAQRKAEAQKAVKARQKEIARAAAIEPAPRREMNYRADITAERLRELLEYDPLTGEFRWLIAPQGIHVGDVAGTTKGISGGYRIISVAGTRYRAHRLAWLYVHSRFPDQEIDHIDHNPANNALSNLREATGSQNCANARRARNNTSGFKGVTWDKQLLKWRARIIVKGRGYRLGSFESAEAAHAAYMAAAIKHSGEFACDGNAYPQSYP
jgi:hypothetical protein